MNLLTNGTHYTFEHKGASYSLPIKQVNDRNLDKAAEFLSGETRDFISYEDLQKLINESQEDAEE